MRNHHEHHQHSFPAPRRMRAERGVPGPEGPFGPDEAFDRGHGPRGGRGHGGPAGFGRRGFDPEGFGPGRAEDDGSFDGPEGPFTGGPGFGPRGGGPRGGFGPRGGRGRGPRRAPRGDVRVAVLLLLAEEPMHGYQLMQSIAERTGGRWAPSPGAIYPTLSQLEDEGLVSITREGGRKLASLTETGTTHVGENRSSWADPFPQAPTDAQENPVDVRSLMQDLGLAVRSTVHSGSDQQVAAVAGILSDARRAIYRVLAGDVPADAESGEAAPSQRPAAERGPGDEDGAAR